MELRFYKPFTVYKPFNTFDRLLLPVLLPAGNYMSKSSIETLEQGVKYVQSLQ